MATTVSVETWSSVTLNVLSSVRTGASFAVVNPGVIISLLDLTVAAAKIAGIEKIYKIGGAQAIAALALGTDQIPKVDKIFGPGNQYVTEAKQYSMNFGISIDMPAGPSELLILADKSANPKYVAADLLSQAEHGIDSQVILVSNSKNLIDQVNKELNIQKNSLSRLKIINKSLENSKSIFFESIDDAIDFINELIERIE